LLISMRLPPADRPAEPSVLAAPHARVRTRAGRWIAVLAVVLVAHGLAGNWVARHRLANSDPDATEVPVQIALLTPQKIERGGRPTRSKGNRSATDTASAGSGDSGSNTDDGAESPRTRPALQAVDLAAQAAQQAAARAAQEERAARRAAAERQAAARDAANRAYAAAQTQARIDQAREQSQKPAAADQAPTNAAAASPATIANAATTGTAASATTPTSGTTASNGAAPANTAIVATSAAKNAAGTAAESASASASANVTSAASAARSTAPSDPATAGTNYTANGGNAGASANGAANDVTNNAANGAKRSGEKFILPPSGDLTYDTFFNGVQNQSGTIHWTTDGLRYQMVVSIPLPFIGTFSYTSEGTVDAFGLAPARYVEQRGHRGQDVTTFDRAATPRHIGFTRTQQTLPLPDGAQDRFSMVMQLASLVRGDPDAYTPGVTRQFDVADNDSGEVWPVEMVGTEAVRTLHGFVEAKHFVRLARRAGDMRRIDVWLAPSLGYLPARLIQTEPNGTQVELLWRGLANAPAQPLPDNPTANGLSRP
jgi:hypothetical protein